MAITGKGPSCLALFVSLPLVAPRQLTHLRVLHPCSFLLKTRIIRLEKQDVRELAADFEVSMLLVSLSNMNVDGVRRRDWVAKCLGRMTDSNREEAQAELRKVIQDAFQAKTLWTVDWAGMELQRYLTRSYVVLAHILRIVFNQKLLQYLCLWVNCRIQHHCKAA